MRTTLFSLLWLATSLAYACADPTLICDAKTCTLQNGRPCRCPGIDRNRDAGNMDKLAPDAELEPGSGAQTACDHYFAAQYMTPCIPSAASSDELARIKPRFISACMNQIAAPGSGMTPPAIERCASALEAIGCQWQYPPPACDFHGSLPGGAACNEGMQCESGACQHTSEPQGPGGPVNRPVRCGTCMDASHEREACGDTTACVAGFACITAMTSASNPIYTCVKVTEANADGACDELTSLCKPGLYCDGGTCHALHTDVGAPCGANSGPNGCAAPLTCTDQHVCTSPAGAADNCADNRLCANGLVCNLSQQCETAKWAEPGEACDAQTACRINDCPAKFGPLAAKTCPAISQDGEACAGQLNCDAFSDCLDGACVLRDSVVCR